jgi:hypothetical protein
MSYKRSRQAAIILVITVGSTLSACGGDSGTVGSEPRNLVYCDNPTVGTPACTLPGYTLADDSALGAKLATCASAAGCHGANAITTWTLDMSGSVESALAPLETVISLNGEYLVDDLNADCSDMLRKLTDKWGAGQRMPWGATSWSRDETDCFRSYLNELYPPPPPVSE